MNITNLCLMSGLRNIENRMGLTFIYFPFSYKVRDCACVKCCVSLSCRPKSPKSFRRQVLRERESCVMCGEVGTLGTKPNGPGPSSFISTSQTCFSAPLHAFSRPPSSHMRYDTKYNTNILVKYLCTSALNKDDDRNLIFD